MAISTVFKIFFRYDITLTWLPIFGTPRENKSLEYLTPATMYEVQLQAVASHLPPSHLN
jgi:hypothetical protein